MLPSFLTTIFFSLSIVFASRSAKLIGGTEANFWRLACATCFLGIWAALWGQGLSGESLPLFVLSGAIGIGIGDVALFQTLPRLGPRLTVLVVQCLTAPFGALLEWLWLKTTVTPLQLLCIVVILAGIGISLAPGKHLKLDRSAMIPGFAFGMVAALGGAFGAVLSRKAFGVLQQDGEFVDGATSAFQRLVGGLPVAAVCLLVVKWRSLKHHLTFSDQAETLPSAEKWRRVWPWVLANSVAGQTIGVTFYQWAFRTTPAAIVLPVVATSPLVALPITRIMDGERVTWHSIVGGIIAVCGVVGLALLKLAK